MTNLQDKIAALKAGDYEKILRGTEYRSCYKSEARQAASLRIARSTVNAAKVIVLEEQVRVLRESLKGFVEGWNADDDKPFVVLEAEEILAATDTGE